MASSKTIDSAMAPAPARTFQQHIHVFRGIAICLIVGAHSLPSFDWTRRPATFEIINTLCNQSSIFFFFIAGYLFQHLSGRFRYDSYLNQKFKTVILPYLLVSIPAIVISIYYIRQEGMWPWFYDLPVAGQVALFYLSGKHLEPLWFVPTITLYYLAAPIFLKIDRKPSLYWIIVPLLILSIAVGRDGPLGPINKAIYLLPAYLFGMCFSRLREPAERLSARWLWPLLVASAATFVAAMNEPKGIDLQILLKLLLTPLMILLLKRHSHRLGGRLDYIAHVSFGIFFVHAYFISAFRLAYTMAAGERWSGSATTALFPPSVSGFILHCALVLAASVGTIWLVQRVFPKHSRQLIGA